MLLHRVLTALVGVPVVLAAVWFGPPWLTLIAAAAAAIGVWEAYRLYPPQDAGATEEHDDAPTPLPALLGGAWAVALVLAAELAARPQHFGQAAAAICAVGCIAGGLWIIAAWHGRRPMAAVAYLIMPPVYIGGGLACAVALRGIARRDLPPLFGGGARPPVSGEPRLPAVEDNGIAETPEALLEPAADPVGAWLLPDIAGPDFAQSVVNLAEVGCWWLLLVMLTVYAADSGAYAVGRRFGRRRMAPGISPGKTWEGTAGGLAAAALAAMVLGLVFPVYLEIWQSAMIGVILGAISPLGDLLESKVKRLAGAKDSGNLFPGHGGMLDRLDSLLPSFALVYILAVVAAATDADAIHFAMRRIVILGSTGSIGRQTLDIVRAFRHEFEVVGLAAGNNTALLLEQVAEFNPRYIWCNTPPAPLPAGTTLLGMDEMATLPQVDQVMVALMGAVGLSPTMSALRASKQVALSNKEPIVMAGETLKAAEAKHGGTILPVDSEPSAIWQCLQGEDNHIRRLMITASGGPFRRTPLGELESVTPEQALRHPTWRMGDKITIDSATLMNKAFEVIESHWLFSVPWEDIAVVVHPQSTIHSMVEFDDGSVKAQLGPPSMRLPIQYALFYPQRFANADIPRLDITAPWSLDFEPLESERYPCFDLAVAAGRAGGTTPTVLSAADEVAVQAFLAGSIGFTDIYRVVEQVLGEHRNQASPDLDAIVEADRWANGRAAEIAGGRPGQGNRASLIQ